MPNFFAKISHFSCFIEIESHYRAAMLQYLRFPIRPLFLPLSFGAALLQAQGQNAPQNSENLDAVVVTAESEADATVQDPWLPPVVGASIFSGKKSAVIDFDNQPQIAGNNYRQALSQTPSLLLSEESSPLVSIGYRGLAPHRTQFTQMLRDGLPIHADQFGYPEAYYTPPLDTVDRIEFLHGGASLQYGPQPGGSLNYITHRPRTDKEFSLRTQHVFGSDDLYSTFTSTDGTVGNLGYYAYFNHRQSDGFRSANSDYDLDTGAVKLLYTLENGGNLIFSVDSYKETHGEPGGLSRSAFFAGDRSATRLDDTMTIERDSATLTYEVEPTSDSFFTSSVWWVDYSRYSARQRSSLPLFGTVPNLNSNTIELQEFTTLGWDTRYRVNWGSEKQHTFTSGVQLYHTDSPRHDYRGAASDATTGTLRNQSEREVFYAPIFAENRFQFGKFSITPGLRIENSWQEVKEIVNVEKTAAMTPLGSKDEQATVVLGGLGLEYEWQPGSAVYANVSQGYRPAIFSEAVPTGGTAFVNDDLEEGKSLEYEIGVRSRPTDWFSIDTSVFLFEFTDQIGSVGVPGGTSVENVGDSRHFGLDVATSIDLLALARGSKSEQTLEWFFNATLLDAEFTEGPREGNTPQYAADFIVRTGLTYTHGDRGMVTLSSTWVDDHYGDDANGANFYVPAYNVWDLTAEVRVHENLRLLAGINNLFDEDYFSRVRGDGIDPANGRNFYVGASLEF
jgi:Fe(3+) dicitrate transport protein